MLGSIALKRSQLLVVNAFFFFGDDGLSRRRSRYDLFWIVFDCPKGILYGDERSKISNCICSIGAVMDVGTFLIG